MPSSCIANSRFSCAMCFILKPSIFIFILQYIQICSALAQTDCAYAVYNYDDDDDAAADKVGFQDKKLDLHLNALQFVLNFKCDFYLCILFMHIQQRWRRDVCCVYKCILVRYFDRATAHWCYTQDIQDTGLVGGCCVCFVQNLNISLLWMCVCVCVQRYINIRAHLI